MSSKLDLNGKAVFPGAAMPPCKVITHELEFKGREKNKIRRHGADMASKMGRPSNDNQNRGTPYGLANDETSSTANFGAIREGILRAHDWRNEKLLANEAPYRNATHAQLQKITSYLNSKGHIPKSQLDDWEKEDNNPKNPNAPRDPALSLNVVKHMNQEDPFGGLGYYFLVTRESKTMPIPEGPSSFLSWILLSTPITTQVLQIIHDVVMIGGGRVLIYCDTPWIQQ
jgi:hypothetical protein